MLEHNCFITNNNLKCYTMKTLLADYDLGNYCWEHLNLGGVWFLSSQRIK